MLRCLPKAAGYAVENPATFRSREGFTDSLKRSAAPFFPETERPAIPVHTFILSLGKRLQCSGLMDGLWKAQCRKNYKILQKFVIL
jgi:hypothetical protein